MEELIFTPLSDEEIEAQGLSVSDLWMLQGHEQNVQGPFSTKFLAEKSCEHEDFFEEAKVYNLVIEEWKDFFSSAEFQRRKPKLVPAQNLIQNDDFYILKNGQKEGPFTLKVVKEKVESKDIQVSDEVSVDAGKTWIKLYEHHEFDRRLMKNQEDLPFQPEQMVFTESDKITSIEVARAQKSKDNDTAITGLAFIGRGNDKGQMIESDANEQNKIEDEHVDDDSTEIIEFKLPKSPLARKIESIQWKYIAGFFVFFLLSFGLFNTFNNKFSSDMDKTVFDNNNKKVEKKAIDNSSREIANKKEKPKANKIKPRKIKRYHAKEQNSQRRNPRRERRSPKTRKKVVHQYEDFESIDIDDPRVREELSRELAGDYEEDNYDNENEYVDDYQQERRDMNEDYPPRDQRMDDMPNDDYPAPEKSYDDQRYPQEDEYDRNDGYDQDRGEIRDQGRDDGPYEEVSDFE